MADKNALSVRSRTFKFAKKELETLSALSNKLTGFQDHVTALVFFLTISSFKRKKMRSKKSAKTFGKVGDLISLI